MKNWGRLNQLTERRSFLKSGVLASSALVTAGWLGGSATALAQPADDNSDNNELTDGDIAILRFLAAAEILESDLWTQYAELGGNTNGALNPYQLAFQNLDGDATQYITSNTLDEVSHAEFLNAYLESKGAEPVASMRSAICKAARQPARRISAVLPT